MSDTSPAGDPSGAPHGGRRIGPFTAVQWGAIIVGGVGLGILIKRHTSASAAPAAVADLNATTAPAVANGGTVANGAVPLIDGSAGSGGAVASTTSPTTNQDWTIAALNYLVANNFGSPSDIQRALGDFMAGNPLTPQEKAVIDEAIKHLGSPPEFVPPETDAPVVAPTPSPAPVAAAPAAPAPASQDLSPTLTPQQLNGIQAYLGAAYNVIARYKNGENTMPQMMALGIKVSDLQNNGCTPAQVQLYKVVCQQNGNANLANS